MQRDERIDLAAQNAPRTLSRREFVGRLSAATAGGTLLASAFTGCTLSSSQKAEAAEALADKIGKLPKRRYGQRMGNMMVTPIVLCQDWNRDLYAPGLEAGINYIHKAGYWNEMPEELKKTPREAYYTDITVDSTPNNPDDEERAYRQVVDSLAKNGLKYYDIMRAHFGWKTVAAYKEQRGTYRAFQRLKREGKVRHFGVSQHDYVPYPEIISALIDDGVVDSMQVFFSYGSPPEVQAIFEKAHKAGIGMQAMKVNQNGRQRMNENPQRMAALKSPGMPGRAVLRHVLSLKGSDGKPIFDCCVTALRNYEQFEENVGAASGKIARVDGWEIESRV